MQRTQAAAKHIDTIRSLYHSCKGNLVRVSEELGARHIDIPYSSLTRFCREHHISDSQPKPVGHYPFGPAEEMQHDTSPHRVVIAQHKRRVQCAGLWLGYSRMRYAQVYPTFNRFYAKLFLNDGLRWLGGAAKRCTIDNTSVIVAHGTGKDAVMAPEMQAYADHLGFRFEAHEKGDANRSAGVERFFHYVENNFYPGRTFTDLDDLNRQLLAWCDQINHHFRRDLSARPIELFAAEQPHLVRLPEYIPEVYRVYHRLVDTEAYVRLHTNRYSVDAEDIGRQVCVHETRDSVRIFLGHRLLCEHQREPEGAKARKRLPQHQDDKRYRAAKTLPPIAEERLLMAACTELGELAQQLKKCHKGRAVRAIRQLHRMWLDYPTEALLTAVKRALSYGLTDLGRIERMILRNIAGDFFQLPVTTASEDEDELRGY
jgi:hypothetical protein